MKLFFRRGRTKLGNGFRPAFVRHGQKRPSAVAEPKSASDVTKMSVQELKDFLTANNIDYSGVTLKADLLVLAQAV